jgi:glyoxylase-like metal-dependent hydrolase (beta-lactamase superfamily II)
METGMELWNLGDITVTRIEEGLGLSSCGPEEFFSTFDADVFRKHMSWLAPTHYDPQANRLVSSIHSWLIRTPHHTILLDTCSGNHKNRPWNARFHQLNTPYLEKLAEAGVSPEQIDIVLCTHLHTDHCGWNTQLKNGKWVPTFPNAKYLFSRLEHERWKPVPGNEVRAELYNDSVLPVIESRQAVMLEGTHQIDDLFTIEPAAGHTIGHVMMRAESRNDCGFFCGDVIHHAIQVYEPQWNTKYCEYPDQAASTRRLLLERCVEQRAVLFPTHFAPPYVAGIFEHRGQFSPAFVPPARNT